MDKELEKITLFIFSFGLFLFFILPFPSFSQSTKDINYTDSKGLRQGNWILYWKDIDTLNRCGNGTSCAPEMIPLGYVNEGYRLDTKFMTCTYVDGTIEGLVEKFFPNGNIKSRRFYVNGKTDGLYESFYINGVLKETGLMKNGTQAGVSTMYYEKGNIKERIILTNEGKLNGHWVKYYESGIVKSILLYYAGKRNGYGLVYDENGKLIEKYYYVDGEKVDQSREKKNELVLVTNFIDAENASVFSKRKLVEVETKRGLEQIEKQKTLLELRNQKIQKELNEQKLKNEFEKSQQDIAIAQAKKDTVANKEKQKQRIVTISVSIGLILVLLFSLFIFKAYKQKQKSNNEILIQKQTIEHKQKEILDSIQYAKRIQESLMTKEKYIDNTLNRLMKK